MTTFWMVMILIARGLAIVRGIVTQARAETACHTGAVTVCMANAVVTADNGQQ